MSQNIRYQILPVDPHAHLFRVTLTVARPAPEGQRFWLPAWIPGSYLIREFARNIVWVKARDEAGELALTKLDKAGWQAAPAQGALTLEYEVYAFDLSVRGAYLDAERGFFNATSLCLAVAGQEGGEHQVDILPPAGKAYADWRVATALPAVKVKKSGFGSYRAADYDELIDHPVEMGDFVSVSFKACGVPHDFVIAGRHRNTDLKRLARDCKKICEYQIRLFGEAAPFKRYVFMLFVGQDIYGGLEHRASTALVANRDDLPRQGEADLSDGYLKLLGLISHEYFHSWNVKRIKPAAFAPYDLTQEGYTRLLWAFEGVTSYYDDLTLVRAGLIDRKRYLGLLAQTVSGVQRGSGRLKQSLSDSSLDAWVKYYRQDENSPNAIVSYYTKGALAALALDLLIRRDSQGKSSLDDVMRALWANWQATGRGVAEDEWERVACEVTGLDLKPFFDAALRGTDDLPLAQLLATQGITMALTPAASASDKGGVVDALPQALKRPVLGVKTAGDAAGVKLAQVLDGGAARRAGLSAGDVVIALDGLRVSDLDRALERYAVGDKVKVHAFRRDELMKFELVLEAAPADTCRLLLDNEKAGDWLA